MQVIYSQLTTACRPELISFTTCCAPMGRIFNHLTVLTGRGPRGVLEHMDVGIFMRKHKDAGPIVCCPYCRQDIALYNATRGESPDNPTSDVPSDEPPPRPVQHRRRTA